MSETKTFDRNYYRDLVDKAEQVGCFHIEHLSHLALDIAMRSDASQEILGEMDAEIFRELFPDIAEKDWFDDISSDLDKDVIMEMLIDEGRLGFIAEIGIHEKSNFRFNEEGEFVSCRVHTGIYMTKYVYADTIEGLLDEIKKKCDEFDKYFIEEDKKRQAEKAKA